MRIGVLRLGARERTRRASCYTVELRDTSDAEGRDTRGPFSELARLERNSVMHV